MPTNERPVLEEQRGRRAVSVEEISEELSGSPSEDEKSPVQLLLGQKNTSRAPSFVFSAKSEKI